MNPTTPTPEPEDADLRLSVQQAERDGAETAGLREALAASDDSLDEAHEMADEADDHIREARRQVDQDNELSPEREQHFYESGSQHPELDDQTIAPPG